jgi:hypothetical protein
MRNQEKSIRLELIEDAVAEQLKSQAAEENLEKCKRGTVALPEQIVGSRRRMDDIIIDLVHRWCDREIRVQTQNRSLKARRKHRRGRRSLKKQGQTGHK